MKEYYEEISYGNFLVDGNSDGWYQSTYSGAQAKINTKQFIADIAQLADPDFDYSLYDNDGPDNVPNSGDDDGYVDGIMVVYAGCGAEWGSGNDNLWPHMSSLGADEYETARVQAISVTIGGALQLLWLVLACRRAGVTIRLKRPRFDSDVRELLRRVIPAAAGAGASQINLLISTALSGWLLASGSITYIYYADRLNQLPLGLIGIGLGTILLPTISRMLSNGQDAQAMETQNRGIELALFLTLPATVAFLVVAEPIVRGLFQYGRFTAEDAMRCGWALSAFSIVSLSPEYVATVRFVLSKPSRLTLIFAADLGSQPGPPDMRSILKLGACSAACST